MRKSLIITGHISLLITAVLAIVFYKERCLYLDPGMQLFEMVNFGKFQFYAGRYSMAVNQALPMLGIKAGLPLVWIMILYSLSFVLVYYACFLVSVYGFRNVPAGIVIAFAPLILRQAFAHSISEGWLGLVYSATFYAALTRGPAWRAKGPVAAAAFYLVLVILIALNYFIHPSTLFTMGFAWGYYLVSEKKYRELSLYCIGILMLVPFLVKFFFPASAYEDDFFSGIRRAPELLPQLGSLPVTQYFLETFSRVYAGFSVLVIITLIALLSRKQWHTAGWMVLALTGYFLIAAMAFHTPSALFAKESRLLPLAMMVLLPFADQVRQWERNNMLMALLIFLLGWSYAGITQEMYSSQRPRLELYRAMLKESESMNGKKFYTFREKGSVVNSWASAGETLLLSSMQGPEYSRTIYFFNTGEAPPPEALRPGCIFLCAPWWQDFPVEAINKKYFRLDCAPYTLLDNPEQQ